MASERSLRERLLYTNTHEAKGKEIRDVSRSQKTLPLARSTYSYLVVERLCTLMLGVICAEKVRFDETTSSPQKEDSCSR